MPYRFGDVVEIRGTISDDGGIKCVSIQLPSNQVHDVLATDVTRIVSQKFRVGDYVETPNGRRGGTVRAIHGLYVWVQWDDPNAAGSPAFDTVDAADIRRI